MAQNRVMYSLFGGGATLSVSKGSGMAAALAEMAATESRKPCVGRGSRVSQSRADVMEDAREDSLKKLLDCTSGASYPAPDSCYPPSAAASSSKDSFQIQSIKIAQGLVERRDLNGKRCVIIGSFSIVLSPSLSPPAVDRAGQHFGDSRKNRTENVFTEKEYGSQSRRGRKFKKSGNSRKKNFKMCAR